MSDATVLVAGASGNIGFAAALALAERGARVVLLGRRRERLEARVTRLLAEASIKGAIVDPETVETLVVDFADLSSVRRAALEARERYARLDALVLSVGVFLQEGPALSPDGHEVMFATNVLGPFALTELLRERLESSNAIVVHVIAPFNEAIDWDDVESMSHHTPMRAFNRTKTCNRIVAAELARRSTGRVASVAFDPTYVIDKTDPDLAARWPRGLTGVFWRALTVLFARHPSVAGEPIARLILGDTDRCAQNGALYRLDKRLTRRDPAMSDAEAGRRLWELLEAMAAAPATGDDTTVSPPP